MWLDARPLGRQHRNADPGKARKYKQGKINNPTLHTSNKKGRVSLTGTAWRPFLDNNFWREYNFFKGNATFLKGMELFKGNGTFYKRERVFKRECVF